MGGGIIDLLRLIEERKQEGKPLNPWLVLSIKAVAVGVVILSGVILFWMIRASLV